MLTLSRRSLVLGSLACSVAVAVPVSLAAPDGGGTPANKAVAAGSKRVVAEEGTSIKLMSATFKTSKPTDLLMSVSLECSILTALNTGGTEENTATAASRVRVWIDIDGKIVPISDVSNPPQDPAANGNGEDSDKVTFCDREYQRTLTEGEEPADGTDNEDDYIRTKSAHSFNWVRLNAGSGEHTATVFAEVTSNATPNADATAEIGNRTFIIEPTKMANSAEVVEDGTSNSGN